MAGVKTTHRKVCTAKELIAQARRQGWRVDTDRRHALIWPPQPVVLDGHLSQFVPLTLATRGHALKDQTRTLRRAGLNI